MSGAGDPCVNRTFALLEFDRVSALRSLLLRLANQGKKFEFLENCITFGGSRNRFMNLNGWSGRQEPSSERE
jgi:hypothetical protein